MAEEERSLEQTPTWAVAAVATVFVLVSLLLERGLHRLGKKLKREKQKPLAHTLEKIKEELMLLGFISLLLTVFESVVASICMPEKLGRTMLPCKYEPSSQAEAASAASMGNETTHARRLFQAAEPPAVALQQSSKCPVGKVQVISVEGLHQLHIFIFVMAVVHVFYSCITVLLGFYKMHSWKKWEEEIQKVEFNSIGPATRKHHKLVGNTFVSSRIIHPCLATSRTGLNLDSWLVSFFRQFGISVTKEDYNCLRLGFIANHKLGKKYNFHGYIQRTMEDDFKVVVGISAYLWAFVVIFLLLNVHGWYTYFWIAFIPFILILLVGTKLQQIITDLALEVRASVKPIEMPLEEVNSTVKNPDDPQGQELVCDHVRPRDDLFWFSRPQLVLYLIHFILFQKTFGITSCIMGKAWVVIVRLVIGVFVQVLCSYSTLPLYALVTQMGSHIKLSIFQESTELAIHGWREKAKERQKKRKLNHHSESSPIRKIFGLSSRSRCHNSQLQDSVKLSQGESHTTPSVPSGDVDSHHQHTEDIRAQEWPSDGSHTVEIVEQPSAATAQGEQQPAPAHVTSGTATSSIPHSVHAVNQLLMAKRSGSQGDTN
ncbi:hypothetical protein BDL97_01G008300 [Sphagnum fallax]|nr:hypothetical protein BDL97_01G008300 [Sphagnum fallax]